MFRRKNLGPLGMNFSVANPDSIDPVHQLRDQIKIETGVAEGRDFLLGRDNYVRIFNCVIEVVPGHGRSNLMRVPLYFKRDPPALQRAQGNDEIGVTRLRCGSGVAGE